MRLRQLPATLVQGRLVHLWHTRDDHCFTTLRTSAGSRRRSSALLLPLTRPRISLCRRAPTSDTAASAVHWPASLHCGEDCQRIRHQLRSHHSVPGRLEHGRHPGTRLDISTNNSCDALRPRPARHQGHVVIVSHAAPAIQQLHAAVGSDARAAPTHCALGRAGVVCAAPKQLYAAAGSDVRAAPTHSTLGRRVTTAGQCDDR